MRQVAERINQLGGNPNFNPEGLAIEIGVTIWRRREPDRNDQGKLVAERIACEHYRELIRYFADKDPTTRGDGRHF